MRHFIFTILLCAGASLYGQNPAMIKAFQKKAQEAYDEGNYDHVLFCIDSAKEHLEEGTNNSDLLYLEAKTYYAIDPLADVTTEVIQEYVNTSEPTDMRQEEMADMLVTIELAAYEEKRKTIKPQKTLVSLEVKEQAILARNVFATSIESEKTTKDTSQSKEFTSKEVATTFSYENQNASTSSFVSSNKQTNDLEIPEAHSKLEENTKVALQETKEAFTAVPVKQAENTQVSHTTNAIQEENQKAQAFVNQFNAAQRQSTITNKPIKVEKTAAQKAMEAMKKAKEN